MSSDIKFMKEALSLGSLGMNNTSPNPRVGCVIVKDGKIIGKGYHKSYGSKHAEIEAINSATDSVKDSTLYVTLEPCSHQGKTPPCVDRIVSEGISKVVIGIEDPNPEVKGIEYLLNKNIDLRIGILKNEARELIRDYIKYTVKKKPYVTVKAALSLDGKIATKTGDSQWISNIEARSYTTKLRGENDAILVGAGTVNKDNPRLTYRLDEPQAKHPLRIVVDGALSVNPDAQIIGKNTVVYTLKSSDKEKKSEIRRKGAELVELEPFRGKMQPELILDDLYKRNIMSVLIEGGGDTIGHFINHKCVDRVMFVYAPIIISGKEAPTVCDGEGIEKLSNAVKLKNVKKIDLGEDFMIQGDIV
jgi:diaminohydroxyphosphoribosylaminopyrimidine deaminase/5-amino-6-(5-phosphoribosylamino)uracil reductase